MKWPQFLQVLLMLVCTGCAPGLGKTIRVDRISDSTEEKLPSVYGSAAVEKFSDLRQQTAIAVVGDRAVQPGGDVSLQVRNAFEDLFRDAGGDVTINHERSVRADILNWKVTVKPDFPASRAEATAEIRVTVQDDRRHSVHTAYYTGSSVMTHPFLSDSKVEQVLGAAMRGAIVEVLSDKRFQQSLTSKL